MRTNERISAEYGLKRAREERNEEAIRELESIMPYPGDRPITRERIIIARKWPQYFGGLTAFRSESTYFFNAPLLSPEYEPGEVAAIQEGNVFTLERSAHMIPWEEPGKLLMSLNEYVRPLVK